MQPSLTAGVVLVCVFGAVTVAYLALTIVFQVRLNRTFLRWRISELRAGRNTYLVATSTVALMLVALLVALLI